MTPEECAALGCLHPDCLRAIGEPPSSIDFLHRRAEQESPSPLLMEPGSAFPAPAPIDTIEIGCDSIPVVVDPITAAADRIQSGEPLLAVFGDLCRVPMEKL